MSRLYAHTLKLCLILMLSLGFAAPGQAQQDSPTARLEHVVDEILPVLRDESLTKLERRDRVREELYDVFDFRAMSQSVLSTYWREASREQQEKFQELFARLLENTYVDRLDAYNYNNERVTFRGEEIDGDRAQVRSVIVTDNNQIPVNYRLRRRDDGWYVYDVIVENVSLVSNYRQEFRGILRNSGIEGLLEQMQHKVTELQQQQSAN